ncbi:MAG: DUF2190 family protein, partial [Candidatus Alcyoniella australis]|nr:DUF2190 family protein [Candidatus Alcyoniella australis]
MQYRPILTLPFTASGAVAANRFVGHDGALCGADAKSLGVTRFGADDGKAGETIVLGTAVLEVGEQVAKGDRLVSDANGKGLKATALAAAVTAEIAAALDAAPTITAALDAAPTISASVDAGDTPVTSTGANGEIITASSDAPGITASSDTPTITATTTPEAVLSGGTLPQAINAI